MLLFFFVIRKDYDLEIGLARHALIDAKVEITKLQVITTTTIIIIIIKLFAKLEAKKIK